MRSRLAMVRNALSQVLGERKYLRKAVLAAVVTALASLFLMNFVSLPGLVFQRELLFADSPSAEDFVFLLLFSLLAGVAYALYSFKSEKAGLISAGEGLAASGSGFFALFTSACSVCQPLLLFYAGAFLGIPASFAFLPLKGFEFRIISLGLLSASIYFLSKPIVSKNVCEAPVKKSR